MLKSNCKLKRKIEKENEMIDVNEIVEHIYQCMCGSNLIGELLMRGLNICEIVCALDVRERFVCYILLEWRWNRQLREFVAELYGRN